MEKKTNILLDMDGVLVDFISGALESINRNLGTKVDVEEFAREFGSWNYNEYFHAELSTIWDYINQDKEYWIKLKAYPWAKDLYEWLKTKGEVTIVTAPSSDVDCSRQKAIWLRDNLGITPSETFIGFRKYLMAGNGILIDDCEANVINFNKAGGKAILIPSTWNTVGLTFDVIKNKIKSEL